MVVICEVAECTVRSTYLTRRCNGLEYAIFLIPFFTSCASQKQVTKGGMYVKKPINWATAEGDIRALRSEKTTATKQMATGGYNKMLDDKTAEIKMKCGVMITGTAPCLPHWPLIRGLCGTQVYLPIKLRDKLCLVQP
jgi:hypothetical protein